MSKKLTRRQFLQAAGLFTGSAMALGLQQVGRGQTSSDLYLPLVAHNAPTSTAPAQLAGRVVHIRDSQATSWSSGYFYNAVNQTVVNDMVLQGLQQLTGQAQWAQIWDVLFRRVSSSGYVAGQKIAVKVSFNNSIFSPNSCTSHNNQIDALPQVAIALLNGLVAAGVSASNITLYDASGSEGGGRKGKLIPNYFRTPVSAAHPGVKYVGLADSACSGVAATTYGKDPSLSVPFSPPVGGPISTRKLADVLYDATYLINMPVAKIHGGDQQMPVSLSMKNHYGSIDYVYASSPSNSLHSYMTLTNGTYYRPTYSPLVDLNKHAVIKNKTALILGDMLFGAAAASGDAVKSWKLFNGAANSLFFAVDPVAVDCVMTDFLRLESSQAGTSFWQPISDPNVYDFLFCAEEAGLGKCEGSRSNPGGKPLQTPYGSGYSKLTYIRKDI